jgi:DNA primase
MKGGMMTIVDLIARHTGRPYRRKTHGGEYCGPCPWCNDGDDRFNIWADDHPRYWCRVCGRKGDAIQFLRDYAHLPFAQAQAEAAALGMADRPQAGGAGRAAVADKPSGDAPGGLWQERGREFVRACRARLFAPEGERALAWLHKRGLEDATLQRAGIGYCAEDSYTPREAWGLEPKLGDDGRPKPLWIPRGVVIPWIIGGDLWDVNIRRPAARGDKLKYYRIQGGTPALYNADCIVGGRPAVLVEGELDALTLVQAAGNMAAMVATGSTTGARRTRWLARLGTASPVLVAYDADEAGEDAAAYWVEALPHARRWRPYWGDANELAQAGVDLRGWVAAGLTR